MRYLRNVLRPQPASNRALTRTRYSVAAPDIPRIPSLAAAVCSPQLGSWARLQASSPDRIRSPDRLAYSEPDFRMSHDFPISLYARNRQGGSRR
jgi:hypothetical protein